MNHITFADVLVVPTGGRWPSIQRLSVTPVAFTDPYGLQTISDTTASVPHPEVFMEHIAKDTPQAWGSQIIPALDGMNKEFTQPYILYYPSLSQDGMPFPINNTLAEIQGKKFDKERAWRGNLVIAKYTDKTYTRLTHMSIADYPVLKNYLSTHYPP
ncbi:hypothetical protein BV25DRAFT_1789715, partial [Artomyces pyxidatus]